MVQSGLFDDESVLRRLQPKKAFLDMFPSPAGLHVNLSIYLISSTNLPNDACPAFEMEVQGRSPTGFFKKLTGYYGFRLY
jgi:hypothetical protein